MITEEFAKFFAGERVKSWNSHDLNKILRHYPENFTIETPVALKFVSESKGIFFNAEGKVNKAFVPYSS